MPCPVTGGIDIAAGEIVVLPNCTLFFFALRERARKRKKKLCIGRLMGMDRAGLYAGTACRAPTERLSRT
jgi:hypothetical protein